VRITPAAVVVIISAAMVVATAVIAASVIARIPVKIPAIVGGPVKIDTDKPRPGATDQRERHCKQ
jgi:hypothetical protein